jgi:hypothetical protein
MRRSVLLTALVGAALLSACASVAPQPVLSVSEADRAEIEARVFDYFDGQGFSDAGRLDRAFADNATMHGVMTSDDGAQSLRKWPDFQKTLESWGRNDTPPGERDGEILSVSVVDDRIATVQFRSADRFYDALTLVKINGDWVIATKVFVRQ